MILPVFFTACNNAEKPTASVRSALKFDTATKKPRQDDIKDAHGCLSSAGYVWSAAKDSCIRLWEAGSELQPTDRSELVVYAVESQDRMRAEIFIPDDTSFLLTGTGNGTYSNDSFTLVSSGKTQQLKKSGRLIYATATSLSEPETTRPNRKKRR